MKKILVGTIVCIVSFVSLFSGCVNVPKEATQFSIYSFHVEPSIITQGESANLSWVVLAATTVSIDNGIGNVALTGHRIISPMQTTTYVLTTSNVTMTKTATVTVTVRASSNDSHEGNEISIVSFDASPSIIDLGSGANLSWVVTGATEVHIDHGIGSVALSGHRLVIPIETTTYTLTALNSYTSTQASVVVYIRSELTPPPTTPTIACTTDSTMNRVTITTADINVEWSDIAITTNDQTVSWQVFSGYEQALDVPNHTNSITTNVIAGDYIQLTGSSGTVLVTMRYIPTNTLLGTWTVTI